MSFFQEIIFAPVEKVKYVPLLLAKTCGSVYDKTIMFTTLWCGIYNSWVGLSRCVFCTSRNLSIEILLKNGDGCEKNALKETHTNVEGW